MTHSIVISNTSIGQDEHGRYCLNHLHKAAGGHKRHQLANWLRSYTTKELIAELEKEHSSETKGQTSKTSFAIHVTQGGQNPSTYAVKELVYAYAMWISPKFHLHVIRAFDGQPAPALPAPEASIELIAKIWATVDDLHLKLDERDGQIIRLLADQQQILLTHAHQINRMNRKVITTQGQLIRTQKHVTTLVEGRMDGAQASATIVQMHREGHSNAQIVAATGRNHNHVRQVLWQARRDGVLPPLGKDASAQTALFEGA